MRQAPGRKLALVSALIGLLLIAVAIAFEADHARPVLMSITLELLKTVGVAILAFTVFNIILETTEWQSYIEERLKNIVVEQSYIATLSPEVLTSLQTNVLKAQFRDSNIDHEGSFFNYFHSNLHRFIAEPYREDVTCEIECREGQLNTFNIFDRVTYTCRKSLNAIQPQVSWFPDPDEFVHTESLTVEIQYPATHIDSGTRLTLEKRDAESLKSCDPVHVSLEKYKDVDGLIVIATSEYTIDREHFQYWQMAHPTRNLDITIKYPDDYDLQTKPLVLSPKEVLITKRSGYLKMKYDSWMLPQSGLAWRYIKRKPA